MTTLQCIEKFKNFFEKQKLKKFWNIYNIENLSRLRSRIFSLGLFKKQIFSQSPSELSGPRVCSWAPVPSAVYR